MELKRQYPGFEIIIYCNNVVMDIWGGYSKGLRDNMRSVVVERGKQMLRRMQKAVLHVTSSLNNERSFKILC